jgi:hypothetical protein
VAMAGYGLGMALHFICSEVIKGSGRSSLLNWQSSINLPLGIGLIVVLLPFGLIGIGLAISITEMMLAVLMLGLAGKVVGCSLGGLLQRLVPPLIGSLIVLAVVAPLEHLVTHSDQRPLGIGLALLGSETVGFALLYLVMMRLIDPSIIDDGTAAVRTLLERWRRRIHRTERSSR